MKKLIANIADKAGKTAWQNYTLRLGIDILEVEVPLKNAPLFEAKMLKPIFKKQDILVALNECNGKIK